MISTEFPCSSRGILETLPTWIQNFRMQGQLGTEIREMFDQHPSQLLVSSSKASLNVQALSKRWSKCHSQKPRARQ